MNGYQRIVAALKGERPDKIPVMLHNFMPAAAELNISMGRFRESPTLIAEAFINSVEKYGLDGVLLQFRNRREPRLDLVNPDLVELARDGQLLLGREMHAWHLLAVP